MGHNFVMPISPLWVVTLPDDTSALIAALPLLDMHGYYISFSSVYAPDAFQELLSRWTEAMGEEPKGIYCDGERCTMEVPFSGLTGARLGKLAEDLSSSALSKSISIQKRVGLRKCTEILVDSYCGELYISPVICEERVQEFCRRLSTTYRQHVAEDSHPHWRTRKTRDRQSFFEALPTFPADNMELRFYGPSQSPAYLSLQVLVKPQSAAGDCPDELERERLRIPVTQANMDVVAKIFANNRHDFAFDHFFVCQNEKTIMVCTRKETDVYPDLNDEQMKAFFEPLGLKYRRLRFGGMGPASLLVSLTMSIWMLLTRPKYMCAPSKQVKAIRGQNEKR